VPGAPRVIIRRANKPVTVDGDLADWQDVPQDCGFTVGPDDPASGDPVTSDKDLSARIQLAHDDNNLHVAIDVSDDLVRHNSKFSWQGDGVVLLLSVASPKAGVLPSQYDFVFNYTVGPDPQGRILQDHTGTYPPDKKPVAPGKWAFRARPGGYIVEIAVPLDTLKKVGFRPEKGGLGLGFSIYDADQPDGETTRQSAISWNQRKNLYDVKEAALVQWEK
jgi:hypothetical protein